MKKLFLIVALLINIYYLHAQAQELNGVTIGFGFGASRFNQQPSDYSLSPDSNRLVVQPLSRTNFVISTVLTIKFNKLSEKMEKGSRSILSVNSSGSEDPAKWNQRFTFNVGINLADVSSTNVTFNKQIDGGVGIGYVFTNNVQLAGFFDIIRQRQMRDYIVEKYEGRPIPNGTTNENYNALDVSDNKLFYNKTFTGFSIKVVIALNPKKQS
jgi:hypothetical protein